MRIRNPSLLQTTRVARIAATPLRTVWNQATVHGMSTTTASTTVLELHVDRALLEHRRHLPETAECHCGYRRDDVPPPAEVAKIVNGE